ncbi:YwiC-like family protein [Tepidibacillus marianensis]|uniref:YwiC-like family protein n=1 Tax=Tepidibacillus marianensis TaxID=3131995 RepID=UPI0030D2F22B
MRLILPKEHGAWAMWIAPFFIGALATQFHWYHPILFIAIFFAYISVSPFIQGLKRSVDRRQMWALSLQYLSIALLIGVPFFYFFPMLFFIILTITPFFLVNLYFAKQKRERALLNDLSAMIALTSTTLVAYELGNGTIDRTTLFLWGLTFYSSLGRHSM